MRNFIILLVLSLLITPLNVYAGFDVTLEPFQSPSQLLNTDIIDPDDGIGNDGDDNTQLTAYYDLRDRQTFLQITNFSTTTITIHVQIFQQDRQCDELNFFDELTPNDTVIYNMDSIVRNNGSEVPVNLADDSYGYVVISDPTVELMQGPIDVDGTPSIIGNFRIIDDAGYEYRTNMVSPDQDLDIQSLGNLDLGPAGTFTYLLTANFNTIDDAKYTDIIGFAYRNEEISTVSNIDEGFSFDIFVFDMNEEPLSCDRRNFACGNVMNYGLNEDYPNSKGNDLLCPGGGMADPQGGYITFANATNDSPDGNPDPPQLSCDFDPGPSTYFPNDTRVDDVFVNFIGINNGNGTGSMDTWHYRGDFLNINDAVLEAAPECN